MKIDLLFKDAQVYNVFVKQWQTLDVVVLKEKILFTGNAASQSFQPRQLIECDGRPLIPGLIDIHLHIESSLCTPSEFARAVLARGTTTVVSEPHEIANVFGLDGIQEMIRVSANAAIDIFYGVPSSVPSTSPGLETSGGIISPEDAERLFREHKEVICLGEVMDFGSLLRMEDGRTSEMISAVSGQFPLAAVEGHCPSIRDLDLAKVLYAGVDSDHCLQDVEGMRQRFNQGMFVELQEKSILPEIIAALNEWDGEGRYAFVTDDVPPDIMIKYGHLDHVVRKALKNGLTLEKAVAASSWTPACRMGFRDRGAISPGKLADLLLLADESSDFTIQRIFRKGREIAVDSAVDDAADSNAAKPTPTTLPNNKTLRFDKRFAESLRLTEQDIRNEMFQLNAPKTAKSAVLRTMEKNTVNTYTRESTVELPVIKGRVRWENTKGNLVLVVNRYSGSAEFSQGYLSGCYFQNGAVVSSHAHDNHNLLAAGDNRGDMEIAMKWVIANQGGICVVSNNKVVAALALPVGGILSEEPLKSLADGVAGISRAMSLLGFEHQNPLMSFSTLTLPVSPELKITDKGLIRTGDRTIHSLFL